MAFSGKYCKKEITALREIDLKDIRYAQGKIFQFVLEWLLIDTDCKDIILLFIHVHLVS